MTIGVDGNEANVEKKVGVSVYTFELIRYFSNVSRPDNRFIVYLRHAPRPQLPTPTAYFKYRVVKGDRFWSQFFLPFNLYVKRNIDVFFSPAHYAPRWCPVPTVVTIHDLSYFYYPDQFLKKDLYQLRNWTKYSLEKAKKIIAVSETTKKDLIKLYQVSEEKIEVIYNGVSVNLQFPIVNLKSKFQNSSLTRPKYILYVGTIQPRKNLTVLIEAFSLLTKEEAECSLIIVGKKGWLYQEIFTQVERLNLEDKVVFTSYISDEEKAALYAGASLFILPSLYEGFGIPILEAMSCECPVIASSTSSLPEVGGDACLYFDPQNAEELKQKMVAVLTDQNLRQTLVKKGKERVKLFSWQKCGQQTLQILQKAYVQR